MAEPSAELLRRARMGDGQALGTLVEEQQTYVYSIAQGLMGNPADAADMTQEAFIRLLRSLHTFRGETKFTTWLYRLATNICLDELRRRGRPVASLDKQDDERDAPAQQVPDNDPWTLPEVQMQMMESSEEVRAALLQLPAPQRLALTLHYFQDMRYEEIADVMNVPLNTVKSHLRRGKERMAVLLRQIHSGEEEASWTAGR